MKKMDEKPNKCVGRDKNSGALFLRLTHSVRERLSMIWLLLSLLISTVAFAQETTDSTPFIDGPKAKSFQQEYYYDAQEHAFHIPLGHIDGMQWSPSSRRLLIIVEYGNLQYSGRPMPTVQKDLEYMNYCTLRGSYALLVFDTDKNTVSPVRLPFTAERIPYSVAWGDEDSLLLIGKVEDGKLLNQRHNFMFNHDGRELNSSLMLTQVDLRQMEFRQVVIPPAAMRYLYEAGGTVDFAQTVRVHSSLSLISVSFWRPQVVGGMDGVLFFDLQGKQTFITDKLDRNSLRNAVQLPEGYSTPKGYFKILGNRTSLLPDSTEQLQRTAINESVSPDGKRAKVKEIFRSKRSGPNQAWEPTGSANIFISTKSQGK